MSRLAPIIEKRRFELYGKGGVTGTDKRDDASLSPEKRRTNAASRVIDLQIQSLQDETAHQSTMQSIYDQELSLLSTLSNESTITMTSYDGVEKELTVAEREEEVLAEIERIEQERLEAQAELDAIRENYMTLFQANFDSNTSLADFIAQADRMEEANYAANYQQLNTERDLYGNLSSAYADTIPNADEQDQKDHDYYTKNFADQKKDYDKQLRNAPETISVNSLSSDLNPTSPSEGNGPAPVAEAPAAASPEVEEPVIPEDDRELTEQTSIY